jgi:signal transduction histidine kinase
MAREPISPAVRRQIEEALRRHGIASDKEKASTLCRLNVADVAMIDRHVGVLRSEAFFSFADSCASIAQAARISETSSQKIAEIVRALKYYAYSDQDRIEQIQINDSMRTALVLLRNQLKHAVRVVTDLDPTLPLVACTSEIHQVWTNLLTNACDAVLERGEGEAGEIGVRTFARDGSVVVTVTDNGVGIPEDRLDQIFDPFVTTKDIGKGTGLGLSIVSGIVKKHRGTVRVESRPGRTTFEVELPVEGALEPMEGGFAGAEPRTKAAAPAAPSDRAA